MSKKSFFLYGSILVSLITIITILIIRIWLSSPLIISEQSYGFLLELRNYIGNFSSYFIILNIVLSLISFILFIFFLKKEKGESYLLSLGIFVLTPTFIYTIFNPDYNIISIFLTSLILFCIRLGKNISILCAILLILIVSMLPFSVSLLALLLILAFSSLGGISQKTKKTILNLFFTGLFITLIKSLIFRDIHITNPSEILSVFFSFLLEFGNSNGVSIIFIIITILSLFTLWIKKSHTEKILFILIIISLLTQNIFYFSFFLIMISGKFIEIFFMQEWHIKTYKIASLLLLSFFLVLNLFFFMENYLDASPTDLDMSHYMIISQISSQDSYILYDPEKSSSAEFYSKKKIFSNYGDELEEKISSQIFYSTSLEYTCSLLSEYNISHIIITEEMKERIWSDEKKGLLVMVEDKGKFEQILSLGQIKIYQRKNSCI